MFLLTSNILWSCDFWFYVFSIKYYRKQTPDLQDLYSQLSELSIDVKLTSVAFRHMFGSLPCMYRGELRKEEFLNALVDFVQ